VRTRATASFRYKDEDRTVDVGGIRFHGGYWYVVGWDRTRGDARTFRVDRIAGAVDVGPAGSAALPEGFDTEAAFAVVPWQFGPGEVIEVEVAVDRAEAPRVVTELGADAVAYDLEGGDVVVRMDVTDVEALISWVLGLLDRAVVISPPSVRDAVVARLEAFVPAGGAR